MRTRSVAPTPDASTQQVITLEGNRIADQIDLTGAQAGVDQDATVLRRVEPSGCAFYSTTESEQAVYRFRRER